MGRSEANLFFLLQTWMKEGNPIAGTHLDKSGYMQKGSCATHRLQPLRRSKGMMEL